MNDNLPIPPQAPATVETTLFKPSLYSGRFTRKQYFWRMLLTSLIFQILAVALGVMVGVGMAQGNSSIAEIEQTAQLLSLIITIPASIFFFIPIAVKRAHDIGHKGTFIVVIWVLSLIAQLVGAFAGAEIQNVLSLLVLIPGLIYGCMLLFMDSQKGTNAYGPSTKYPDATV